MPSSGPTNSIPSKQAFKLAINGKLTVLTLLVLPLLLALGFWQLERATQKREMLVEFKRQQTLPPQSVNQLSLAEFDSLADYQRISAEGVFDNEHLWLIDNKTRAGQVGYELVQPFRITDGPQVLVNRGWLKAGRLRSELPKVAPVEGRVTLFATVRLPLKNRMLSSELSLPLAWPMVVLQLDASTAEQAIDQGFAEKQLYINAESQGALVTGWKTVNIQPEKHTGYAVQWFAMAFAITLWFCFASTNLATIIRQIRNTHEQ